MIAALLLIIAAQFPSLAAGEVPGFESHTVKDLSDRTIHYYLSKTTTSKLPVLVFLQGSGCDSVFLKDAAGKIRKSFYDLFAKAANHRYRVVAIEKVGVPLFYENEFPGQGAGCPRDFLENQTKELWGQAILAVIDDVTKKPHIDSRRLYLVGSKALTTALTCPAKGRPKAFFA